MLLSSLSPKVSHSFKCSVALGFPAPCRTGSHKVQPPQDQIRNIIFTCCGFANKKRSKRIILGYACSRESPPWLADVIPMYMMSTTMSTKRFPRLARVGKMVGSDGVSFSDMSLNGLFATRLVAGQRTKSPDPDSG